MALLLGIDIGTTNTKLSVYSEDGELRCLKSFSTPCHTDQCGTFYQPEEIFNNLIYTISSIQKAIKRDIVALSVSSFAETLVGIDKNGNPITKAIAWFDTRTKELFQKTKEKFNEEEIYNTTGLLPYHIYSFYKLLWCKENQSELFKRVDIWTSMSGYILYAFCGEASFDYSLASRTMLFDQRNRCWWKKLLHFLDIPSKRMADLLPSGTALGKIKMVVADNTDLPEGLIVVTGGHDHLCAALSAGVYKAGNVLISTGTTESLTMSLDDIPIIDVLSLRRPFTWGRHSAFPHYYAMNGIYGGGYSIDWILKVLGNNYSIFDSISLPKDIDIPIFFPYLRGSDYEEARGAILNLDSSMDKEKILQGVVAGLCFEFRSVWKEMEASFSLSVENVTNVGGGTKNHYWMKIKSTILGHKITVPEDKEGSSGGAAILAGIASGIYSDIQDAFKKTFKCNLVYNPDLELKGRLDKLYYTYYDVMEDLKAINRKIKNRLSD